MVITNTSYLDSYYEYEITGWLYQLEIPGWFLPKRTFWMIITNMKYLDVNYQHEMPGWLLPTRDTWNAIANMRYLDGYCQLDKPGWLLQTEKPRLILILET